MPSWLEWSSGSGDAMRISLVWSSDAVRWRRSGLDVRATVRSVQVVLAVVARGADLVEWCSVGSSGREMSVNGAEDHRPVAGGGQTSSGGGLGLATRVSGYG
ncbi:uncharacterized protein A4U43_C03F32140 [Asparagus officinalis]|uniref:Uncharacterized protein n=1 Tax=Asparagus officinalis TaxID=4686 RepID=A0A5P1FH96_ASPOF|nr:uncharacterized protein A4U43_C03F32140 [Asparagus officinalis]